jgi:hypothetical protein
MINILKHLRPKGRLHLTRLREAITQTIHKSPKMCLIATAIDRVPNELKRVVLVVAKLRGEHAALEEHADVGDVAIQGLICYANFGKFGVVVVVLATLGIIVGMTAMDFGIVHSLADESRPEQSIRRGKAISLVLTAAVVVSGSIVAYIRFAGAETSDAFFDQAATAWWVLAEMLPIAAGAWLAVAYQRAYPLLVEAEIREWGGSCQ